MSILITGGSGYIGSHVSLELLRKGKSIIILDNLSQSSGKNVEALKQHFPSVIFLKIDLNDYISVNQAFTDFHIDSVIHLAGKKSVAESNTHPLDYYQNNVQGTLNLLKAMENHHCYRLIFSSSATVYGIPDQVPIPESSPIRPINPYGQTKAMIEQILHDMSLAPNSPWKIISLRYFNPVGLDPSKLLREESKSVPENLFPYILKVLKGELPELTVFGNDYETKDGTAIRDYIHISDLANAHIKALEYSNEMNDIYQVFNIGTGLGFTVLEIIQTFDKILEDSQVPMPLIKYRIGPRRVGDAGRSYADANKAYSVLSWETEKTLMEMCRDSIY